MRKKKKLKLFIDGEVLSIAHFSGIGHYTADLLRAIDDLLETEEFAHVQVEVSVPRTGMPFYSRFDFKNFKTRRIYVSPRVTNKLKSIGWIPPIDIFFGRKVYLFPHYSSWRTLFSPVVPIIYDLSFIHYSQYVSPPNLRFLVKQVALSAKRAKRIVTISKNSRDEIAEYYHTDKNDIHIAYPAVDRKKFYPRTKEEIAHTKATYGIFGKYLLFVGNLEPRKNLVTLLKAYEALPAKLQKEYDLLLVGAKGWLDSDIHETIIAMRKKGLRVVQPSDYVTDDDLPALYSGAGAFVYVSLYEGFGIPPLEAMACGTPVITSDNSALPEAVGDGAIKINATDTKQLAKELESLLTAKSNKSLNQAGLKQTKRFSWQQSARELLIMLEKVY